MRARPPLLRIGLLLVVFLFCSDFCPAQQNNSGDSVARVHAPNPEDVREATECIDEIKSMAEALLANKDDSFFKRADAIKNAPDLPSDITRQLSRICENFPLLKRPDFRKLLERNRNEFAVFHLLLQWYEFTKHLKNGSIEDARSAILRPDTFKPKDITPEYLPLWQVIQDWENVFQQEEPKFTGHMHKAQSLADLGKTSDAIKEYQAAYDIIRDPSIPEKIKKLQAQSLGL